MQLLFFSQEVRLVRIKQETHTDRLSLLCANCSVEFYEGQLPGGGRGEYVLGAHGVDPYVAVDQLGDVEVDCDA
jgi:hypothetical protein